tara:strand:- start:194 stop:817 length:624 start_codon:yes stop_codon:yes gene_type:complete
MSVVNDRLRYLFVHVPKCAGSSMTSFGWNRGSGHSSLQCLCDKNPEIKPYFRWAFVRNPWDRMVSAHQACTDRIQPIAKKWNDFDYFLKSWHEHRDIIKSQQTLNWHSLPKIEEFKGSMKVHFFPQTPLLKLDGRLAMDFIGRYENLKKDWKWISTFLGHPNSKLSLRNKTKKKAGLDYRDFYTDDLIEIVADLFEEDVLTFEYTFE